jgi:hypothetical protein
MVALEITHSIPEHQVFPFSGTMEVGRLVFYDHQRLSLLSHLHSVNEYPVRAHCISLVVPDIDVSKDPCHGAEDHVLWGTHTQSAHSAMCLQVGTAVVYKSSLSLLAVVLEVMAELFL